MVPNNGAAQGRVRWRRFAALLVPAAAVAGALMAGVANGAVPAAFSVSGQAFKVGATKLEGEGFVQYGGTVKKADNSQIPVAISGIASAKLYDLCQSVKTPNLPIVLTINAGGGGTPATAENLLIDMSQLEGDAVFKDINIGQDASTLDAAGDIKGTAGGFAQQASKVTITGLRQVALGTSAATFTLNGLVLKLHLDGTGECF